MVQRYSTLILLLALMVGDAQAHTGSDKAVKISPKYCQRLVQHTPSADVAYKPGVDVRGNPVAPADLPGQARITAPNEITFNLTLDLLKQYGIASDSPLAPSGEATIGTVKYDIAAGRLTFNGEPLTDPEQSVLAAGCSAVIAPKK